MSKAKIIIIIVFLIGIVGFLTFFALNLSKELKEEKAIRQEIDQIMELKKNKEENKEQIDLILSRKLTTKNYLKVEIAAKSYFSDLYNYIDNINYLASSETVNYLSAENIKKERDTDFTVSKQNIQDNKNQITDNINKLIDLTTNEKIILGYLDQNGLKQYYIDFYKDLISKYTEGLDADYINNKYGFLIKRLEIYEDAIDFLVKNKKEWGVPKFTNDAIEFYDEDIKKEFETKVAALYDNTKNIQEQ